MALQDFLDYARNTDNTLTWNVGARQGNYKGRLVVVKKNSLDTKGQVLRSYRDLVLITAQGRNPNMGSAENESPFTREHTIQGGEVIKIVA